MNIFDWILSQAAQDPKVMTISIGEMFGKNFLWFEGKILKIQQKQREMPLK